MWSYGRKLFGIEEREDPVICARGSCCLVLLCCLGGAGVVLSALKSVVPVSSVGDTYSSQSVLMSQ